MSDMNAEGVLLSAMELHAFTDPSMPFLMTEKETVSWSRLEERARQLMEYGSAWAGRKGGIIVRPTGDTIAWLAALEALSCPIALVSPQRSKEEVLALARELNWEFLIDDSPILLPRNPPHEAQALPPHEEALSEDDPTAAVTILTSGSTGKPKAVRHSWKTLSRPVRIAPDLAGTRWLATYPLHLYAGLQVLLHVLLNGGTLIVPPEDRSPSSLLKTMVEQSIDFVSATPSFWRNLLRGTTPAEWAQCRLRQITLGGEAVDQSILNRLSEAFPDARITHIYATTEMGRCFAISDRQAGFPRRYLESGAPEGIELRLEGDELMVRSRNAMRGYEKGHEGGSGATAPDVAASDAGWFATGDLVEVVEDRVYFRGRKTDLLNIGGHKVHPLEIEAFIRRIPGVADVRAYGVHSSVLGTLVACDLVAGDGTDASAVQAEVLQRCAASLSAHQRPRLVNLVPEIPLTEAGKRLGKVVS